MAIKFMISGFEASGKTSLSAQIKDALVINFDNKEYTFPIPHANCKNYEGIGSVTNVINSKLTAYKEKFGKFPKYVILDTITQLYSSMTRWNATKYNGFDIHSHNNTDTLEFNKYLEEVLISNGISLVIIAHTIADEKTGRLVIPAQGQFAKAGSWHSIVNESIFIDKSTSKLVVHFKSFKYPARTTLDDVPEKIDMKDFDINKYLEKLTTSKVDVEKYVL